MDKRLGNTFGLRHGWCSRANPSPEYRAWSAIKSRCFNPKVKVYPHYGGRGITMCDRWKNSFENFIADVGARPSAKHSIERKDNDGNYEPGNVEWALFRKQQNNRRNTIKVTVEGVLLPLSVACEKLGVDRNTVWMRIDRGWTPERAITTPARSYRRD